MIMKLISTEEVTYCFFSKKDGGFSRGNYASLNGSKFVGDDETTVERNWTTVVNELNCDRVVFLNQIHSNKVLKVKGDEQSERYDAMVTDVSGIALGIVTADCAPLLLWDDENGVVGAAHAGWRGAVSGVIENTVEAMRELGAKRIKAVIGPCIHAESYSVAVDFRKNFGNADDCFYENNGQLHFDLPKFCKSALLRSGVTEMDTSVVEIDTYINHESYFSYRYAVQNSDKICGRNISAICLNKKVGRCR